MLNLLSLKAKVSSFRQISTRTRTRTTLYGIEVRCNCYDRDSESIELNWQIERSFVEFAEFARQLRFFTPDSQIPLPKQHKTRLFFFGEQEQFCHKRQKELDMYLQKVLVRTPNLLEQIAFDTQQILSDIPQKNPLVFFLQIRKQLLQYLLAQEETTNAGQEHTTQENAGQEHETQQNAGQEHTTQQNAGQEHTTQQNAGQELPQDDYEEEEGTVKEHTSSQNDLQDDLQGVIFERLLKETDGDERKVNKFMKMARRFSKNRPRKHQDIFYVFLVENFGMEFTRQWLLPKLIELLEVQLEINEVDNNNDDNLQNKINILQSYLCEQSSPSNKKHEFRRRETLGFTNAAKNDDGETLNKYRVRPGSDRVSYSRSSLHLDRIHEEEVEVNSVTVINSDAKEKRKKRRRPRSEKALILLVKETILDEYSANQEEVLLNEFKIKAHQMGVYDISCAEFYDYLLDTFKNNFTQICDLVIQSIPNSDLQSEFQSLYNTKEYEQDRKQENIEENLELDRLGQDKNDYTVISNKEGSNLMERLASQGAVNLMSFK